MGLAAPRPFGGERREVRLGCHGQRQRGRERVERVIARQRRRDRRSPGIACRALRRARPAEETWTMGWPEQREDDVAPRVDVVDGHEQFAESRLSEIVREQFDVAAREVPGVRRRNRRCASNQVPQFRERAGDETPRGQRRADETPHPRVPRAPAGASLDRGPRSARHQRGRLREGARRARAAEWSSAARRARRARRPNR